MKSRIDQYTDSVFEYITTDKSAEFWVVTAYNPDGISADPGDNLLADSLLHAEIGKSKLNAFRIIGMSRDESHAEPGWGIECDEQTALDLGRRCRQEAVFHFSERGIDLVDCKDGKRQPLENPASRIRDPRGHRHFSLYVGSPPGRGRIDPLDYAGICTRVGALFPGFTIQRAEGCFQSRFEDSLIIHVTTREPHKVLTLAHELRCFLRQDGIGIMHHGICQRIREWTDDALVLEAFGLGDVNSKP